MTQPPSYYSDGYLAGDSGAAWNAARPATHSLATGGSTDGPYGMPEYVASATVQPAAGPPQQPVVPLPRHGVGPPGPLSGGPATLPLPPSSVAPQSYYHPYPPGQSLPSPLGSPGQGYPGGYPMMGTPTVGYSHPRGGALPSPLPAEAYGARNLVEFLYGTPGNPASFSHISPPNPVMVPEEGEVGLPLVSPSAPIDEETGRRLVYLGRAKPPVSVVAETRMRGVAICFKPLLPPGAAPSRRSAQQGTSYGTVLGYSDDDTAIVWHDRAERFASVVDLSRISTIHRAIVVKCRHCGLLQLRSELREHIATHKKGSGFELGLFTGDDVFGWMCGDTSLIQCMSDPKKLGEGGQGVVELYNIRASRPLEDGLGGHDSECYSHPSRHLAPDGNLLRAVVKTMKLPDDREGMAQYQKSVRFMAFMNHEHLVEYLAVQLEPDLRTLRIAMPFYSEGDLRKAVGDRRPAKYAEETFICTVGLQLSVALAFLHERNPPIVHGDIKLENVMFYNREQQIVLMDLDASRELRITEQAALTDLGTAEYMAPETMNNARLMTASDMWSLGVLLYVLVVNPADVMIEHPTEGRWLLNGSVWATPEDRQMMNEFLRETQNSAGTLQWIHRQLTPVSTPLGECVRLNIERRRYSNGQRRYSPQLTQLIVDLLSYSPWRRPDATEASNRLTDIMTRNLLASMPQSRGGRRSPPLRPVYVGVFDKARVALHEYQDLCARQGELEEALGGIPTSLEWSPRPTPVPGARTTTTPATLSELTVPLDTDGEGRHRAADAPATVADLDVTPQHGPSLGEDRHRLRTHVRAVKAAMQHVALLATSAVHSDGWRCRGGAESGSGPPTHHVPRLSPPATSRRGRAQADFCAVLAAARYNMSVEWQALAREEAALATVPDELDGLLMDLSIRREEGEARELAQRYDTRHDLPLTPSSAQADSGGPAQRRPVSAGVHSHHGGPAVYTGSWLEEEREAAEAAYADFLTSHGGPTLGWPASLHEVFLRLARDARHRATRELPDPPARSYTPQGLFSPPRRSEVVESSLSEPMPAGATDPLPSWAAVLRGRVREALYTIVDEAEIDRHVGLYLRYLTLSEARQRAYAVVDAHVEATNRSRQYGAGGQAPARDDGEAFLAGNVTPRRAFHSAADALEATLRGVEVHHRQRTREEAVRREQLRRQIAEWRAARAEAEAGAEAGVGPRRTRQGTNRRAGKSEGRSPRPTAPTRGETPLRTTLREESRKDTFLTDRAGARAGTAPNTAVALMRREVRRLNKEVLDDRWQRDLEATHARRARITAAKASEAANTKAAAGARYLADHRALSSVGQWALSRTAFTSAAEVSPIAPAVRLGGGGRRYHNPTATRVQHVLPSEEAAMLVSQRAGERGKWLSHSAQEMYAYGVRA